MKTNPEKISKIHILTLGCAKNLVDSEHLAARLRNANLEVVYDTDLDAAPVLIINTCGFIHDAKQESIDTILQAIRAKKQGKLRQVFVMGCLSERYKEELKTEIPEIDKYFGVNDLDKIIENLDLDFSTNLAGEKRYLHDPGHFAYLKISEGCNRTCAFCAIPLIRGPHISVGMNELLTEAQQLAKKGTRELILVAQDLSSYGSDLYGRKMLPALLEKLTAVNGLEWIRLHYLYPSGFPKQIVQTIKNHPQICRYLDIPFQHISNHMLRIMRRGSTSKSIYNLIEYLRKEIPEIALRTTLLVGHPGETEKDFRELEAFVRNVRFERLGVFSYSHEEGTYGEVHYSDDVPAEVKKERLEQIMLLQKDISAEKNQALLGCKMKIIIDHKKGNTYVGRTEFDSPEVDNEVLVASEKDLKPGTFVDVIITGADDYDLIATLEP